MLRIALLDDHPAVLAGLRRLIDSEPDLVKSRPQPPAVIIYSAYAGSALTLAARAAQADGVVDKAGPAPALLAAVRSVANGEVVMSPVPRDVFEAAVARLDDVDPLRIAESHGPRHWQGTRHPRSRGP